MSYVELKGPAQLATVYCQAAEGHLAQAAHDDQLPPSQLELELGAGGSRVMHLFKPADKTTLHA